MRGDAAAARGCFKGTRPWFWAAVGVPEGKTWPRVGPSQLGNVGTGCGAHREGTGLLAGPRKAIPRGPFGVGRLLQADGGLRQRPGAELKLCRRRGSCAGAGGCAVGQHGAVPTDGSGGAGGCAAPGPPTAAAGRDQLPGPQLQGATPAGLLG